MGTRSICLLRDAVLDLGFVRHFGLALFPCALFTSAVFRFGLFVISAVRRGLLVFGRACLGIVLGVFFVRSFSLGFAGRLFNFDFGLVWQAVSAFGHHVFARFKPGDNLRFLSILDAGLH